MDDRAIAQVFSHRLPTAVARIRDKARPCGIYGGQSGTGASILRVLRFPLSILIPPIAPHSSSIVRNWYNRPVITIWFVRLLALRPLVAYCASLG
jgi:hypothetical protein